LIAALLPSSERVMNDPMTKLFTQALGLPLPWRVDQGKRPPW